MLCRFSADLRFTYVNEPFCRIANLPESQILGAALFDLIQSDQSRIKKAINKMFEHPQRTVFEMPAVLPNGEKAWQQWIAVPILDEKGGILEVQASCRDITLYKSLENSAQIGVERDHLQNPNKFHISELDLSSLFGTINDMLFLISPQGEIIKANPAVGEKLGYDVDSLTGKSINFLLPAESAEELNQILKKIAQLQSGSFRLPFLTAKNEIRQVEMDLSYGVWDREEMIVAICRDISYRVEVEKSEREQRVLASALADVATILNSSLNLEEVLDRILENVGNVIPNTSCNIMFVEGNRAKIVRTRGYESVGTEELLMARVFNIKKIKSLYKMAYSLQPAVSEDTATDANWSLIPESMWVRSYVAAPITFQGKLFGFINCDNEQAGYYNRGHALKLKLFADQAGIAMENAILFSEARRHARQMTLINDLTRVSLNSNDFNNLLENLPSRLEELFQAQNVYITRLDETTNSVYCIATTHPHKSNFQDQLLAPGSKSLTIACLEAGKALFVNEQQKSNSPKRKDRGIYSEKNLLALPMIANGKKIGAIIAGFGGNYASSEVDIAIGEYAANQVAPVISKMLSLDHERTQSEQLGHTNALIAALSRVGTSIVSSSDTSTVMNSLGTELEKLGIHSMLAIAKENSTTQVVQFISQEEVIRPAIEKLLPEPLPVYEINSEAFPFSEGLFKEGRPQFIENPESIVTHVIPEILSPFKRRLFSILSIRKETRAILLPLTLEGRISGILVLWGDNLKQVDTEAFSLFGYQTSAALENAALLEKIKRMAITDEMTGIYNRRGINDYGQHEIEVASRMTRPLSAIMFDLDHFKIVNDTYGHPIGDQVLCEIVRRCKEKVREIDLFGRYGGEEFLLLIIGSGLKQACVIAERLRLAVGSSPIHTDAGDLSVTISLGVTTLTKETRTIDDMIKAADIALYHAKNKGRNKVSTGEQSGTEGDDSQLQFHS